MSGLREEHRTEPAFLNSEALRPWSPNGSSRCADGFAEAMLPCLRDERVALRGVAGDAVEDRRDHRAVGHSLLQ
jgi:hypothetical protein